MDERDKNLNGYSRPNFDRRRGIRISPLATNGPGVNGVVDCIHCAARISRNSTAARMEKGQQWKQRIIEIGLIALSVAGTIYGVAVLGGFGV